MDVPETPEKTETAEKLQIGTVITGTIVIGNYTYKSTITVGKDGVNCNAYYHLGILQTEIANSLKTQTNQPQKPGKITIKTVTNPENPPKSKKGTLYQAIIVKSTQPTEQQDQFTIIDEIMKTNQAKLFEFIASLKNFGEKP